SGPVIEVKMTGNGSTKAAFEPNSITIPSGATVRFTNVAGGPHNITFWSDSVPAGGAAALNAGMKNTVDNLSGPFLTQPNETYEVSFANAPKGTYKGYCTPHLTLGMKLAIKVQWVVGGEKKRPRRGGCRGRFLVLDSRTDERAPPPRPRPPHARPSTPPRTALRPRGP